MDIVPIISLPTCIPLINNSFIPNVFDLSWISAIADDTDIATSITAPSDAINIPAKRRPPILICVFCPKYTNVSMLDTLYPSMSAASPKIHALNPEISTPSVVPSIADIVLRSLPPIRYIVTIVVTTTIITAAQNGDIPRYIIGRNINMIIAKVNISPITDFIPLNPPMQHINARNTATYANTATVLSLEYTPTVALSPDTLNVTMTLSPL